MKFIGIPYLIEKLVNCGSAKYPIRDTFNIFNKTSFNQFSQPITSHDYTCYQYSTIVENDYYNLMQFYVN